MWPRVAHKKRLSAATNSAENTRALQTHVTFCVERTQKNINTYSSTKTLRIGFAFLPLYTLQFSTWTCYKYESLGRRSSPRTPFPNAAAEVRKSDCPGIKHYGCLLMKFGFIWVLMCLVRHSVRNYSSKFPFLVWKTFRATSVFHNRDPSQNWPNINLKIYSSISNAWL